MSTLRSFQNTPPLVCTGLPLNSDLSCAGAEAAWQNQVHINDCFCGQLIVSTVSKLSESPTGPAKLLSFVLTHFHLPAPFLFCPYPLCYSCHCYPCERQFQLYWQLTVVVFHESDKKADVGQSFVISG